MVFGSLGYASKCASALQYSASFRCAGHRLGVHGKHIMSDNPYFGATGFVQVSRTSGWDACPRSRADVREAPRHEVAGCGAAALPQALWGLYRTACQHLMRMSGHGAVAASGLVAWVSAQWQP